MKKIKIFDENHGLSPLQKCQFCGCLKPMFSLFTNACLLYKTFKIVFLRFIFTIYDMGILVVTRGYKRLQRVTRVYKGLQGGYNGLQEIKGGDKGVTRGCSGLQEVSGGYKGYSGLQRVTGGYKGLQGVARGDRELQGVKAGYKGL